MSHYLLEGHAFAMLIALNTIHAFKIEELGDLQIIDRH